MLDQKKIKILRVLEPHGFGKNVDLSPTLLEMFPIDSSPNALKSQHSEYISQWFFEMNQRQLLKYRPFKLNPDNWLDKQQLFAAILPRGIEELHAEELRASVIATNAAVMDNGRLQGKILIQQTLILYLTLFVTVVSVAIAFYTAIQDDSKRRLERKLEVLESNTQALQSQLESTKRIPSSVKAVETSSTKEKR